MQVIARPLRQPSANLGMLVSGIVIDHEVDIVGRGNILIEVAQEGKELLMAVAGLAFGEHPAVGDIEGGKQSGGAMAT